MTNVKIASPEPRLFGGMASRLFWVSDFGFRISFGFRHSSFGFEPGVSGLPSTFTTAILVFE